ncbi:MAG: DUF3883 domain-containing protein [Bacteroidetes bacterium]|nr:DUF3883 domain-containing protein [Bacteroidota bacterium]
MKYIEVKSTRKKVGITNFIITKNETEKAKKLKNYYIYVVFEAHTLHPKIWKIKKPFKLHKDLFLITPVNYKIEINIEKNKVSLVFINKNNKTNFLLPILKINVIFNFLN